MRRPFILLGFSVLLGLGGCAAPQFQDPAARAQALATFRAGQATMSCGTGIDCMIKWNLVRPSVTRLVQAQRWDDVAESVLATGYDIDLSWYYLGLAAANLNDVESARSYFDMAAKRGIMGGMFSCRQSGDSACDGVNLPDDASTAMASLPPPMVAHAEPLHHRHKQAVASGANWVAPVSASSGAASPPASGWVAPAPAATSAAGATP